MVTPRKRSISVPRLLLALAIFLSGIFTASALHLETVYKFPTPPRNPEYPLAMGRDGWMYGITQSGGTNDTGTFFKISPTGTYKQLMSFGATFQVNAGLVLGPDGNLYGTTSPTYLNDLGTIFRINTNGVLKVLVTIHSGNGTDPRGLIVGKDKNIYGIFDHFNTNSAALFRMNTNGVVKTIATNDNFTGSSILQGRDGNFYGVRGGLFSSFETVFKVTPAGVFSVVYEFNGTSANTVYTAALIQATNGTLYGLNENGGEFGKGSLFKVTTNGTYTDLHSFAGTGPSSPLTLLNGVVYGATDTNIFKLTASDEVTNVVSFDAAIRVRGLTVGRDGNFYCPTVYDGTNHGGAILRVTPAGEATTLKSFDSSIGASPEAELNLASDNSLYGTTAEGGANGRGTIFTLTSSGAFSNLLSFAATDYFHDGGVRQASDGNVYGTMPSSLQNYHGSIFRLGSAGQIETIAVFDGTNGSDPNPTLVQGADGRLYGVTLAGGNTNGDTLRLIYTPSTNTNQYTNRPPRLPPPPLPPSPVQTNATAASYGIPIPYSRGQGTVFAVSTNGEITTLVRFNGTNGAQPSTKLVPGNDGAFYGTTMLRSVSNNMSILGGTVFKVTTGGELTTLVQFTGTNGYIPSGLTLANDGYFYGTTSGGGKSNVGTIFKMTAEGALTTLVEFTRTNGEYPNGIIQASNGKLYGTTLEGGKYKQGTLYEMTTNGAMTVLTHFAGTNGAAPYAALTETPDGSLYGTTTKGGYGAGVIFRYGNVPPTITTQPLSRTNALRSTATFTVRVTGPSPYTYQWLKNGAPIAKATRSSLSVTNLQYAFGGIYSVIVSNMDGFTLSSNALLTIAPPPLIISQPENRTVTMGTTASFDVAASSLLPLRYQWQFKGVSIAGKTGTSLTLTNVQTARAGGYRVIVSNGSGSVTSSNAVLTVQTCSYTLSTNIVYIGSDGGSGSVLVSANLGDCSWLTANTNSWISLTSAALQSGDGSVTFNIAANTNNAARIATVFSAGTNFMVVQAGTLAPDTIPGKTFAFTVVNGAGVNFRLVTSLIGSNFVRLPAKPSPTNYVYQRAGASTSSLTLPNAGFFQLTYDSPYTGTYLYIATNNDVGTGTFSMTDSKPDYNGDGSADMLWQNIEGKLRLTLMSRTNVLQTINLPTVVDASWKVMGQADFNGDGNVDLLMQNSSGLILVYYMQGTNFLNYTYLNSGNPVDTAWHIAGLHDMDNDGKADILFQHSGGALWVWLMNGITVKSSYVLRNGATPGSAWRVALLADFNNDGQTDILFEHDSGYVSVWFMNGTSFIEGKSLFNGQPLAGSWRILGANDYNFDGQLDLLLEDPNGDLIVWLMTGINRDSGFSLLGVPPESIWKVVGPK